MGEACYKMDEASRKATQQMKDRNTEMIERCKDNTRRRKERDTQRKNAELKYMKESLSVSLASFKSIVMEEKELQKMSREQSVADLNPSISSIVEIPPALTEKVKKAKRWERCGERVYSLYPR